ncbi:hypothetical protein D3C74_260960 [compost metagenome]
MRQARVQPERGHAAAVGGDAPGRIQRVQLAQQLDGARVRRRRRRVEPRQLVRSGGAPRRQLQRERREVRLEHLRRRPRRQQAVLRLAPEAVAHAGRRSPGTPPPLVGGVAGRARRHEPAHAGARREQRRAAETAVDHHRHAVHRQARLGDRRRQHDFAPPRRRGFDRPPLLRLRQRAVQRRQHDVGG